MFKPIFWVFKLIKLICNKLGNENQHMFQQVIKKKLFPFCKNLLDTYLKLKTQIEKCMSKTTCILKNLLKTCFYNLQYENQCTLM